MDIWAAAESLAGRSRIAGGLGEGRVCRLGGMSTRCVLLCILHATTGAHWPSGTSKPAGDKWREASPPPGPAGATHWAPERNSPAVGWWPLMGHPDLPSALRCLSFPLLPISCLQIHSPTLEFVLLIYCFPPFSLWCFPLCFLSIRKAWNYFTNTWFEHFISFLSI